MIVIKNGANTTGYIEVHSQHWQMNDDDSCYIYTELGSEEQYCNI